LIDCYENNGEGFSHYIGVLASKPYVYGKHYPPHDIAVRELGTGKSRKETAKALGLTFEEPVAALDFADGIDATRLMLARCWFDEEKCAQGLEALRHYRKSFNTRLQEHTGTPVHDWSSHYADAARGLAVRHQIPRLARARQAERIGWPMHWQGM
jgi:phage terminase large subunit